MKEISNELMSEVEQICKKVESNENLLNDDLTTLLIASVVNEEG